MTNHTVLYNFLLTRGEFWTFSGFINVNTGLTAVEIRKIVNNAPQTFISSQRGYKLARLATANEVEDSIRTLMSRAEKIMHRARSLQRYSLERNKANRRLAVAA